MAGVRSVRGVWASLCMIVMVSGQAISASAGDWPGWRGPNANGVAEGTGYPVEWSAEKNLIWKFSIGGLGASTPAVVGDRIFLTATSEGKNVVIAVDMSGRELWRKSLGKEVPGKPGKDGTGANPSPVTDGERVFVYFKSGDLAAYSLDGDLLWTTNLQDRFGEDTLWWDLGTSPVIADGAVVVACMHSGPSYVAAFEAETGALKWKQDRNLGAPEEAAQSYATPQVIHDADGNEVIVVLGADHVTAHSAKTGKELWRLGGLNPTQHKYFRSIASAVATDDIVVAPYARGDSLTAIRTGGTGDVTESHILWFNEGTSADVPTPTIAGDRVFVLRDVKQARGTIDCLDLQTGKEIWSGQLEKHRLTFRASPVVADGRLYVVRQDSTVFVLDANGDSFEVLSKNRIADEHLVATPVFVNGRILLRTDDHLYLIAETEA